MHNPAEDDDPDEGEAVIARLDRAIADGTAGYTVEPPLEALKAVQARLRAPAYRTVAAEATAALQDPYEVSYAPMPPDPPQAVWRIWSNVHQQWYLPEARGYTPRIEESGRFMPMEALQIYEHSARGWDPHNPFSITITLVPA